MRYRDTIASPPGHCYAGPRLPAPGPAAIAAARVSRAGLLLGFSGLASALFFVVRLAEVWRVTPPASSHRISLFGLGLSYPTANVPALIVLLLALFGFGVTALAAAGAARELAASRRFRRRIAAVEADRLHGAIVFEDPQPRAFCAGLVRPRVYLSTGAVGMLDEAALRAVWLHEREHARRYDPLRLATARVLARALFFVPGLAELVHRQQALAELGADERSINDSPENRSALARAMLSFSDGSGAGTTVGIDPERVDYLLGEQPTWRFPALLCLASVSVLALMTAVGVLLGQGASGAATLNLPFLSSQPCVLVLATMPALLVLGALGVLRTTPRRASPSTNLTS